MYSPLTLKPLTIIVGHYGVGKTNLTLNFAHDLKNAGHDVTVVDLDIVNPYFRSSDYAQLLESAGIDIIAPTYARTTLDTPSLGAATAGAFEQTEDAGRYTLIDVGGDDAGATALGRFRHQLKSREYDMLYVVNANRNLTQSVDEALEVLAEIEAVTGLQATGIINNTHLQVETTCETIKAGELFGQQCAKQSGLPLVCMTVPAGVECEGLSTPEALRYPTKIYVKQPW